MGKFLYNAMSNIVLIFRKNQKKFICFGVVLLCALVFSIVKVFVINSEEDEYLDMNFIKLLLGEKSVLSFFGSKVIAITIVTVVLILLTYNDTTVRLLIVPIAIWFIREVTECLCAIKYYLFLGFIPTIVHFLSILIITTIFILLIIEFECSFPRLEYKKIKFNNVSSVVLITPILLLIVLIAQAILFTVVLM